MRRATRRGKPLSERVTDIVTTASDAIALHRSRPVDPIALDLGFFQLRWYSLAYLAGIFIGYWYLLKLLKQPGAPMARRHADDLVFYATLGIILGGRLGYVLFYNPALLSRQSARDLEAVGRRHVVPRRRDRHLARHPLPGAQAEAATGCASTIMSPAACPFGLFFGRLANFVNQRIVGRADRRALGGPLCRSRPPRPKVLGPPRHPSQLYEAGLEGLVLFAILWLHVLEDPGALPAGQAGRRLHLLLRHLPLRRRIRPRARHPAGRISPQAPACTWASGCRCR